MRPALLCLLLAVLTAGPGCQCISNGVNCAVVSTSQSWSAEKAWRCRKGMYADVPCRRSFKAGFKAGYRFARGGCDTCEPPMPQHFWRINGVSDDERANAQAWSDGFTHGTLAAQQDGAVAPSAFDSAAAQPPNGVPEIHYLNPPPSPYGMDTPNGMPMAPDQMPTAPNGTPPDPYGTMFAPNGVPEVESMPIAPNPGEMPLAAPPLPASPTAEMPQAAPAQGVWLIPSSVPQQTVGPDVLPLPPALPPSVAAESSAPYNAFQPQYPISTRNPTPQMYPNPPDNGVALSIRPAAPIAPRRPGIGSLRAAGRPAPVVRGSGSVTPSQPQPRNSVAPAIQSSPVQTLPAQSAEVPAQDWELPVIRD